MKDTVIPAYAISNLANTWKRRRRRHGRPSFTKCPKFNELFLYRYLDLSRINKAIFIHMACIFSDIFGSERVEPAEHRESLGLSDFRS